MTTIFATLIAFLSSTYAWAQSPNVRFGTNLDAPKVLISARDSLNYRLSDGILEALVKINKTRAASDQIQYMSFGSNYTAEQARSLRIHSYLPNIPIIDPAQKSRELALPWYRHVPTKMLPWMQDAFKYFHDENGMGALEFTSEFRWTDYLDEETTKRVNYLNNLIASDSYLANEKGVPPNVELEEIQNSSTGPALATAAEKAWLAELGIKNYVKLPDLQAQGGDFQILKGDVIIHSLDSSALKKVENWLKGTRYENRLLAVDTSMLQVGHVDEMITDIPSNDACGFSILTLDTALGVQLLKQESKSGLSSLIPADYKNMGPNGDSMASGHLLSLYNYVTLGKDTADGMGKKLRDKQIAFSQGNDRAIAKFQADYAKLNPNCGKIRVIKLPALVSCPLDYEKLFYCRTLLPNPVNSVVLDHDLLVSDPFLPKFRDEVKKRLSAANLRTHFVDSGLYNLDAGNVHCGTNLLRQVAR